MVLVKIKIIKHQPASQIREWHQAEYPTTRHHTHLRTRTKSPHNQLFSFGNEKCRLEIFTCVYMLMKGCRSSSSRSSISCACRHGQLRSTDYRWRARPRSIGVCTFLAPRLGFAITITSRPIRKTPSSGKSVLNCRRCFCGMCSSSGGCT